VKSVAALATPFVEPWKIPSIKVSKDCTNLCQDWAAPYLFENNCIGLDGATLSVDGNADGNADAKFCPDKTAIEEWTVGEELEFEAMYLYSETLDESEFQILQELAIERKMKLAVHPWQRYLPNEVQETQDRRRIQGSAYSYKCFGGNGGSWRWYEGGIRPTQLRVRSGRYVDRLEFTFANNWVLSGGGTGGSYYFSSMPSCTTFVVVKSGVLVDAIQFLSQGYETGLYGGSGGGTYAIVAPSGRCLGDIKMRTGSLIDQICLKFNA